MFIVQPDLPRWLARLRSYNTNATDPDSSNKSSQHICYHGVHHSEWMRSCEFLCTLPRRCNPYRYRLPAIHVHTSDVNNHSNDRCLNPSAMLQRILGGKVKNLRKKPILIKYRSGIHWIWNENWMNSKSITTFTVRMPHFQDTHLRNSAYEPTRHLPISTTMVGGNIAAAYFTRQFPRDYQFAMHTLA